MRDIEIVMATSGVTLAGVAAWVVVVLARVKAPWVETRAQVPQSVGGAPLDEDGPEDEVADAVSTVAESSEAGDAAPDDAGPSEPELDKLDD